MHVKQLRRNTNRINSFTQNLIHLLSYRSNYKHESNHCQVYYKQLFPYFSKNPYSIRHYRYCR
jgi:hypothetical protein